MTRRYRAAMESETDRAAVSRMTEYLQQADDETAGHLIGTRELTQPVKVPSEPWLEHLAGMKLSVPVRTGVGVALGRIADAGDKVDRNLRPAPMRTAQVSAPQGSPTRREAI